MNIIIEGVSRCGKNTLAKHISEKYKFTYFDNEFNTDVVYSKDFHSIVYMESQILNSFNNFVKTRFILSYYAFRIFEKQNKKESIIFGKNLFTQLLGNPYNTLFILIRMPWELYYKIAIKHNKDRILHKYEYDMIYFYMELLLYSIKLELNNELNYLIIHNDFNSAESFINNFDSAYLHYSTADKLNKNNKLFYNARR